MTDFIRKYAIVGIVYSIFWYFRFNIADLFIDTFPPEQPDALFGLQSLVTAVIVILLNLVVTIIIYFDLDNQKSLSWILLVLSMFSPWMSIPLMLIWNNS